MNIVFAFDIIAMYEGGTNMTQQPIKRRNPFDIMAEEEKVEEVKTPVIEEVKPIEEPF